MKQPFDTNGTLVSMTFNKLKSRIESGMYSHMLPIQDELALDLKVSRSVVREAVAMMRTRNMVMVKPKTGTTINPQNEWLVLVPQSLSLSLSEEVFQTLDMFMCHYRAQGWEGDAAYVRAEKLLADLPHSTN